MRRQSFDFMGESVNSYLVWTMVYGMLLGASLALASTVSLWLFVPAVLLAWRLLWNARRLVLWVKAARSFLNFE